MRDTARGYALAAANMAVSGVAVFVNSVGVGLFDDSTLYTALKNLAAGLLLLIPLALSASARAGLSVEPARRLLLIVVAFIGGSVPYALYFRGLQLSTPVTAALIDHLQFLLVAVIAAAFLGERFGAGVWAALAVLLVGLSIGVSLSAVRLDAGVPYVAAATVLFAADFALMKYLLRSVAPLTVMAAKMGLGSVLLLAWVAASGHLRAVSSLSALQWGFIAVTGLILLVFTVTSVLGLRLASATAVTAIPAGAPVITTALVVLSRRSSVSPERWLGLAVVLAAVAAVLVLGSRAGTARAMTDGLLLFCRYAYPPNLLGYCGPADHPSLLGYLQEGRTDGGLTEIARRFDGAYPYLRLIAHSNGIQDPFDSRVVEAYWVGNGLLEKVGTVPFFESLASRFRPRMEPKSFAWLASILPRGARPHHNFHVFDIYRRAGLMRDDRAVVALDRMDQCRISWGTVIRVESAEVIVRRAPLVLRAGKARPGRCDGSQGIPPRRCAGGAPGPGAR